MRIQFKHVFPALLIGLLLGIAGTYAYTALIQAESTEATEKVREPLYWVAPMDANYRRDKPGLSPMGMELVPYYGDDGSGSSDSAGTVKISPAVINNLGVRTATAEFKKVTSSITGMGTVKYDAEQLFHIHPRVAGWIEELHIKSFGQPVAIGQPLYDIYSPELVNAQEELLLALTRNNSRLIQAAENRLKSLQFSSAQIKQLKQNKIAQQRVTFYSPHEGILDNLEVRAGFYVKPGDNIMTVANLAEVWVEVDVLEKQAPAVSLGQVVTMTLDALPGRTWQGKVDFIYPSLDAKSRTLKLRLRFNNPDQVLKPNMFAEVKLSTVPESEALLVPTEAVIRTGHADRVVLQLDEGKFKSIEVTVGKRFDAFTEIIAGLEAGDRVVSSAQFLIDSESSKTSDFSRMSVDGHDHSMMDHSKMDHSKMDHSKMDHSKMDHSKMDHSKMDHSKMDHSKMDHSKMDHSKMDDSKMDHSKMDHSKMDHSKMDHSKMDHSKMDDSKMDHSKMDHSKMDHSKMDHSAKESEQ